MLILTVRHGQVPPLHGSQMTSDGAQLYSGDPALTDLGVAQAQALGRHLKKIGFTGLVLASPYRRTLSTAQHLAEVADLRVHCCPEIREMVGKPGALKGFVGLSQNQAQELCPRLVFQGNFPYPWWNETQESREDIVRRMESAVSLYEQYGQDLILVSHGGPINSLTKAWLARAGMDTPRWLPCWNTQVNRFRLQGGRITCEALGEVSHLSAPEQLTCNDLDFHAMEELRQQAEAHDS